MDSEFFTEKEQFIAIPGTTVRVVLEFPDITENDSLFFVLDDAMSVSYSIYRSKIRVLPLGSKRTRGFGLGTRLVAGSVIRSVFTQDRLTDLQTRFYKKSQVSVESILSGSVTPKGIPYKDFISYMKDDLTTFNIHMVSVSESVTLNSQGVALPNSRYETIYGAVIINTGQVYSVEDLITESTFSFEAVEVRSASDLRNFNKDYSWTGTTVVTGSSLL